MEFSCLQQPQTILLELSDENAAPHMDVSFGAAEAEMRILICQVLKHGKLTKNILVYKDQIKMPVHISIIVL